MKLTDAIERFITSRSTGGYARNTLRNNRSHLMLLAQHLPDREVRRLTADDVEAAFRAASEGRAPSSMLQVLGTLNLFCEWCRSRNVCPATWNPTAGIRPPKAVKRERMRIPVTDFNRIIDAAPDGRDRAILTMALTLMLRQSEIATLTVGDVNLADGELTVVIHKTNQSDTMPIPVELDRELRAWLTEYGRHVGCLTDDMLLFPARRLLGNDRGERGRFRMGQWDFAYEPKAPVRHMETVARKALEACGYDLPLQEGMHTLRRSAARALFDRLVADGYDGAIRMVQAMLHHASIATTERYIGLTLDRKRRDDLLRGEVMYPLATVQPLRRSDGTANSAGLRQVR